MPKRPRRRTALQRQKNKATLPNWLKWLLSELHNKLQQAIVGTLITIIFTVVTPAFIDSFWGSSPAANKVQYYQI